MQFQVVSDSSCDLLQTQVEHLQIEIVPFYVSFIEGEYLRERTEIAVTEFYAQMETQPQVFPKTAMPTPEDYLQAFLPALEAGKDVLCICLNAGFSGSFQAACLAKTEAEDRFPERKILVVDSCCATAAQGLLVLQAAQYAQAGHSIEETTACLEKAKHTGQIYFTTADLRYLKKGGRIGKVIKMAAVALKIKPLMEMRDAELHPIGIVRSRKKALQAILGQMEHRFPLAHCPEIGEYIFAVGHGYSKEEGENFRVEVVNALRERGYTQAVELFQIGATIGVHTGPHPIGFGFVKRFEYV